MKKQFKKAIAAVLTATMMTSVALPAFATEKIVKEDLPLEKFVLSRKEALEFMNDETIPNTLKVFKEEIENINDWTVENISNAINSTKEKANAKGKMLYMPIRIKVSGIMHGPELPDTIYLLGKETILNRLSK